MNTRHLRRVKRIEICRRMALIRAATRSISIPISGSPSSRCRSKNCTRACRNTSRKNRWVHCRRAETASWIGVSSFVRHLSHVSPRGASETHRSAIVG